MGSFPDKTIEDWRKQVEAELKGAAFDRVLVHETEEGLRVQPLYVATTAGEELAAIMARRPDGVVRICTRGREHGELSDDLEGGADAVWVRNQLQIGFQLERIPLDRVFAVVDSTTSPVQLVEVAERQGLTVGDLRFVWSADPLAARARGLERGWEELLRDARLVAARCPLAHAVCVSTLPYHAAGADAADELAFALSTAAAYLRTLVAGGVPLDEAGRTIAVRISVGRDTLGELCKLRALRLVWEKLLVAAGVRTPQALMVHAVCSTRTLSARDPWVNMLRTTTQTFAGILGGADLVTPTTFDEALGSHTLVGRRTARNTGLVLREESQLGRVVDPAAGSYHMESHTDALARLAWQRFQALEREGGIEDALRSGRIRERLEEAWTKQLQRFASRKAPLLGVTEFANLDEERPIAGNEPLPQHSVTTLPSHRDDEEFERLRAKADTLLLAGRSLQVALVPLGPPEEHRARAGFAAAFFPIAGLRAETHGTSVVACLCGSDERYGSEAITAARALKAAGCRRLLLAGRPGALEAALREAGVDDFVFVGCDAVAVLRPLLEVLA